MGSELDLKLAGLMLTATGITCNLASPPSIEEFAHTLKFVGRANTAAKWWAGALANHADDWGDDYVQLLDELRVKYSALRQWALCDKKIPPEIRRDDLDISHHYAVAKFEPEQQAKLLNWCAEGDHSVSELKEKISEVDNGPKAFDPQAELNKAEAAIERLIDKWPEHEREAIGRKLIEQGSYLVGTCIEHDVSDEEDSEERHVLTDAKLLFDRCSDTERHIVCRMWQEWSEA